MRKLLLWSTLLACIGAFAASSHAQSLTGVFATGPDENGLYQAIDYNASPGTVEVIIVAFEHPHEFQQGVKNLCMTFNGSVPGPTINANVGDKLICHFYNFLGEPTSIHWHGVELPALMDGSHISQAGVPAHGGYFRYEFDLLRAATYWYHPHFDTRKQVERGLYGALIVRDPAEDTTLGLPTKERVLILDDVLLDPFLQLAPEWPANKAAYAEEQLDGREGNVLLVNGVQDRKINVKQGVPERWRLINASNARFQRFSIPGHVMYRIGNDAGLLNAPEPKQPITLIPDPLHPPNLKSDPNRNVGILLAPGMRAEVVVTPITAPNTKINLEWHDWFRGGHSVTQNGSQLMITHDHDDGIRLPVDMMELTVQSGASNPQTYVPPSTLRPFSGLSMSGATMMMIMMGHGLPDAQGNINFFTHMINGNPAPFPMIGPNDAHSAKIGDTKMLNIVNMTMGDHPFHLHGFFFQPLDVKWVDDLNPADVPPPYTFPTKELVDTVIVPGRPGAKGTSRAILRALVKFDDTGRAGKCEAFGKTPTPTQSGGWLYHCHVMEHSKRGMMAFINLKN